MKWFTSLKIKSKLIYSFIAVALITGLFYHTVNKEVDSTVILLIIYASGGLVISILFGMYISKIINDPISRLTEIAYKLSLGDVNVSVDAKTDDELGNLERSLSVILDNIKRHATAAEKIAYGDINFELKASSEKDILSKSLIKVIDMISNLVVESALLSQTAITGKLTTRGNEEKFKGKYREIIAGFN
jgi:methyl-accepting chemotaxis protein